MINNEYSGRNYSFEEYKEMILLNSANMKVVLCRTGLDEQLDLFSSNGLTGFNLGRIELLRDFVIQNDLERIMSEYSGQSSFKAENVRVGRGMCGRPSMHVVSIANSISYCESINVELSDSLITDEKQNARSVMGILMLAIEDGRKINVEFSNIQNSDAAKNSFFIDARRLLYGFMCEDLNQFIRCDSPYPLLTSEGLTKLREDVMKS